MAFRWFPRISVVALLALLALMPAAGCGALSDTSTPDGATSDTSVLPGPDLADDEAGSAACVERTAPVLNCVVTDLACLTPNPCPATWSAAQETCPLDGKMTLATTCGFNRWSFAPNNPQEAEVYCFFDPASGALRTIRETVLREAYCKNTSYQRWTGPDLENCDRVSSDNPRTMMCPRSVSLPDCSSGVVDGGSCSGAHQECMQPDGSACSCRATPPIDDAFWHCGG